MRRLVNNIDAPNSMISGKLDGLKEAMLHLTNDDKNKLKVLMTEFKSKLSDEDLAAVQILFSV